MEEIYSISNDISILKFILPKIFTATFIGTIIGIERERKGKSAGIKTNALISIGACLFTIIAQILVGYDKTPDLSRIIAQVVSGVGFLGAGTIFQSNNKVYGLTSAAFVWVVAALGVLAGMGLYASSVALALGCVIVIDTLNKVEVTLKGKSE